MRVRPFAPLLKALALAIASMAGASGEEPRSAAVDFDRQVAPVLVSRCLECHSGADPDGGLSLVDADSAAKGGESGPAVEPGKTASLLRQRVEADEMPPDHPLPPAEKAILRAWMDAGSPWGRGPLDPLAFGSDSRAGRDFWSFKPLRVAALPPCADDPWVRGPVDAWVLDGLRSRGLSPAPPAEPRLLVRRLFFDLVGLPPTPEQVEAFVADPSDAAYERLVDALLASPHHGERWGRHWLDVVRYTESEGFEYDHPRDRAWHYRDYVIRSFNDDKPYDIFMREQIAGDVLEPVTGDGIVATSMLVCGAWDRAGNAQANATQRAATREEEMEDMLSVVGQTFLGLTLNCARCHAHKFDPVPQEDYFRVKAVFDGVKHGERSIVPPAEIEARARRAAERAAAIDAERTVIADLEREGARRVMAGSADRDPAPPGPVPFLEFPFSDADHLPAGGRLHGGAEIVAGRLRLRKGAGSYFESAPIPATIREKTLEAWVVLPDLDQGGGAIVSIESTADRDFDAIVFGERQPRKWIAGSGGFARTHDLDAAVENAAADRPVHMAAVYRADGSIALYRDGVPYAPPYVPGAGLRTYEKGAATVLIGLRHHGAGNGFLEGDVLHVALHDRALSAEDVARSFRAGVRSLPRATILAALTADERATIARAEERIATLGAGARAEPAEELSYAGTRAEPAPTALLRRGDVTSPGAIVAPAALSAIVAPPADLGLEPDAPEAERRRRFAAWLSDPANPLPARVMANRVWQHHFGRGIVATPSDFGFNGARPTHPELLDWLATELVRGGWRLKGLHRRIVLSSTYRQASTHDAAAAGKDADATLLWRYPPHRLEAEAVRDAMLAASGELNPAMGGPSFRPFTTTSFNATFYHPVDRDEPEFNRRTIYRMNVNSGKEPLLEVFDCPSPAVKTPVRGETITPLQALSLMNNSFVQRQADRLAARALAAAGDDLPAAVDRAYERALSRRPSDGEREIAVAAARENGLGSVCWALLNSSEFLHVR